MEQKQREIKAGKCLIKEEFLDNKTKEEVKEVWIELNKDYENDTEFLDNYITERFFFLSKEREKRIKETYSEDFKNPEDINYKNLTIECLNSFEESFKNGTTESFEIRGLDSKSGRPFSIDNIFEENIYFGKG